MELKCTECNGSNFVAQASWVFVIDNKGDYLYQVDIRKEGKKLHKAITDQFKQYSIVCKECGTEAHIGDTELLRKDLPYFEELEKRLEDDSYRVTAPEILPSGFKETAETTPAIPASGEQLTLGNQFSLNLEKEIQND